MEESKKINKIPTTLKVKDEEYIHYSSLRSLKSAKESKKQMKEHFKKIHIEPQTLKKEKIWSIYVIKKTD